MLSECLRAEFAGAGIGVSAICPGFVNTSITATARFSGARDDEEERLRRNASQMYRRRNYPPEKVADAVLRAVVKDIPVLPVTPEARAARALGRIPPKALRALGRIDPPL